MGQPLLGPVAQFNSEIFGEGERLELCQIGGSVHIGQSGDGGDARVPQGGAAVGQSMFRGPAHIRKEARLRRVLEADKPVAAIQRRAKHRVVITQRLEGLRNVGRSNAGDISADDAGGTGMLAQLAHHAITKIAGALWNARQVSRPNTRCEALMIRRNGQDQVPARIVEAAQQRRGLVTEPPGSGGHATVTSQSGFHTAGARFLEHDHKIWMVFSQNSLAKCGCRCP